VDLNDPQNLQFYNQLFSFKEDVGREALIFPSTLNNQQRRIVHTLAHHLNLQHVSRGTGEQRQVHVLKSLQGSGISPPIPQGSNFHLDSSRRVLNRAATTDFSESRGEHPNHYGMMRQGQALHLGIPDSPGGFSNRAELRAAKSHADLRSYTPSPVPSTASFPTALQSNIARFQEANAGAPGTGGTPTLTPTASNNALVGQTDNETLINGIANMGIGSGFAPNGSPRRGRGMYDWSNAQPVPPHTAPIGSNRGTFTGLGGNSSGFGSSGNGGGNMPIRQPAGPERGPGFARARQNGHQPRSSDEMRHSQPEIIVE
jgi:R3H domain